MKRHEWRQPSPDQLACEQRLERLLATFIRAGHVVDGSLILNASDEQAIQAIATELQTAQALGKQYARLYVAQQEERAVSLSDAAGGFFAQAGNLLNRVVNWVTSLFSSKVADLQDAGTPPTEQDIENIIDDIADEVSGTEAPTEVMKIIEQTIIADFGAAGIQQIVWVIEPDACSTCQANADAGPIDYGQLFQSGDDYPPAHPRCRCHVAPYEEEEE